MPWHHGASESSRPRPPGADFGRPGVRASRFVETYLTYCDTKFLGQLVELGGAPEPLGLPQPYGQGQAVGVVWPVEEDLLERTRALFSVRDPVSLEAPARGRISVPVWMLEQLLAAQPAEGPPAPPATRLAA